MEVWEVVLLIFSCLLAILILYSLFCFFAAMVRGAEIDLNRPVEFRLSQYKNNRQKLIEDQAYFDSLKFEEISIKSFDELTLKAYMLRNDNSKSYAIFFHGYRSSAKNDFSCMLKFYISLGYNIILVNQRSHGKSQGNIITYGIKEKFDCRDWTKFVDEKFNPEKIVLIGMSMGASTVLMASGLKLPSSVKAVVADCGFSSVWDIIKKTTKKLCFPIYPSMNFVWLYSKLFAKIDIKKESTYDALKKSKIPTLFIHGKSDGFVPFEMTLKNYNAMTGKKELLLVENATHAGSYLTDTEQYEAKVKEFLSNL